MSSGSNSHESSGKHETLTRLLSAIKAAANEERVRELYIRNVLSQSAPIEIPSFAKIKDQKKNGYNQVKYTWRADGYKYEVRWHTRPPGAPITEGNTWQVRRHKPGVGFGNNARPPVDEVLVKSATGKKWVPFEMWQASIDAKTANRLTKEQRRLLDNGHWSDKK